MKFGVDQQAAAVRVAVAGLVAVLAVSACESSAAQRAIKSGAVHHVVSTHNVAAQASFDAGLLAYYAFNVELAEHDFYTAADLDPHLAMAYWGIAMSNADNLNVQPTDDRTFQARFAIKKAQALEEFASPLERKYIEAAALRFAKGDSYEASLQRYRDAMARISKSNPQDADASALYGEAALYTATLQEANSKDQLTDAQRTAYATRVAQLIPYFKKQLALHPAHVGLLHFFIHVADESNRQYEAIQAAKTLAAFTFPAGDSHLTHMPGHIFLKAGMYEETQSVARKSLAMDAEDIATNHPGFYGATRYYHGHNLMFVLVALTELGRTQEALEIAKNDGGSYFVLRQLIADRRWDDLLKMQPTRDDVTDYAFAHGLAFAEKGDVVAAKRWLNRMTNRRSVSPSGVLTFQAMQLTLRAQIEHASGNDIQAVSLLKRAGVADDRSDDIAVSEYPAMYFFSPHLALAALAVHLSNTKLALEAYRAELISAPKSPSALQGLSGVGYHRPT